MCNLLTYRLFIDLFINNNESINSFETKNLLLIYFVYFVIYIRSTLKFILQMIANALTHFD